MTADVHKSPDTASDLQTRPPGIWLVMGDKLGDNAQLKLVAASLGLPYEIKRLYPREKYRLGKPRFRASLDHLDPDRSDRLEAPWPDLVITIGRRHAMASLWIKEQSPSTKIVLLGRPRRWIEKFDLVIVPPQYSVPAMPNVLHLSLPLVRSDADAVAKATPAWRARLNSLQKPLIAVFVGGATKPFRFDAAAARELLERCERLRTDYAGTLYFSTSRRTSPDIIRVLREQLPAGAQLYEWRQNGSQNPYLALLEFADYCVVTGDSVSMMLEVADRHKPLAIFELPSVWGGRIWQSLTHRLHAPAGSDSTNRLWRWAGRRLYRAGIVGFARDLTRIHQALFADGLAVRLGAAFRQPSTALADELTPIRERILSMLDVPPP